MMNRSLLLVVCLSVFILLGMSTISYAYILGKIPELTDSSSMSDEEFMKATKLYSSSAGEDTSSEGDSSDALRFQVRIPKDWEQLETLSLKHLRLSNKIFGEIFRVYSPPRYGARSSISISAMEMDYEVSATNWLIHYVTEQGFTLEGIREHGDDKVEAQYVLIEDGTSYRVRAMVVTCGIRVLLVQFYVPMEIVSDKDKDLQIKVLNSFELDSNYDYRGTNMKSYAFLDISEVDYPAAWDFTPKKITNVEKMEVSAINLDSLKSLKGQFSLKLISKAIPKLNISKEVEEIREHDIDLSNMQLGKKIEDINDISYNSYIIKGEAESYLLSSDANRIMEHEYWIDVMEADDYYYVLSMITPSRNDNFYLWAENAKVFETVASSIRKFEY